MMPKELLDPQMTDALEALRLRDEPFAVATIVRTAGATAAKPGAKALLRSDGTILHGWLGGGCTRAAVQKAALVAIAQGKPQLVSVAPEDILSDKGLVAGDEVEGVYFARNGCPSKGSVDVFIDPSLPRPEVVIIGASPVATELAELAPRFDWEVTVLAPGDSFAQTAPGRRRAIVIATQGQGDRTALEKALATEVDYVAFVGSRKKYAALAEKLRQSGISQNRINAVRAPAGIDIGAVTPEEIALSIIAELTQVRRHARHGAVADA
ncbi:XdhC family protein [Roseobacter sp. YSTF-M11]|uniref:XdhC family protein n=1 Tax=Roseobacter insulae TaxID=2859783 RepID=A0A9X1K2G4_9RHOB|nr:XdhC family protein [Roseobacter insulae]MBW4710204.1 XdhC family protein [Roseobacter insulae]